MESLYFLVPVALIFIAIAVKILWWAINNGQYDNLDTESHRILFDDEKMKPSPGLSTSVQKPERQGGDANAMLEKNKHE